MKLRDWRKSKGKTLEEVASALNCGVSALVRWENGSRDPDAGTKERIFLLSEGEVTPNDFYDVPRWRRALAALASLGRRAA